MLADWMRQYQSGPDVWGIHLLALLVCNSSPPPTDCRVGNSSMERPITESQTASIYKYFFVNTISSS